MQPHVTLDPIGPPTPSHHEPQPQHTTPTPDNLHTQDEKHAGTSSTNLVGEDQFSWRGHTYRIGPIIFKLEARFEQLCEDNELQGIERRQGKVNHLTYLNLMDRYLDRLGRKHWQWKGLPCIEARTNPEGEKDLIYIILHWYNKEDPKRVIEQRMSGNAEPPLSRSLINDLYDDEPKYRELKVKIRRLTDPNWVDPTPLTEQDES